MSCCSWRASICDSIRYHSRSASSEGAWPCASFHFASSSSCSFAAFSCWSFMAVAWYMESSDTVPIIRRVVSRIRAWNSLTRFASLSVSSRPSLARFRSFWVRVVTSSSTSSFSRSCSFFSSRRDSSTVTFALSWSRSGSSPPRLRHRSPLAGSSSSLHNFSVRVRSVSSWPWSSAAFSASSGMSGRRLRVTITCRSSSVSSSRSARSSSSRSRTAASPRLKVASWRLAFS
mmetsp:Transcript_29507/g.68497  ORF Transcript_29507/g.68497 Transcript_29507/m.68497 type:complete len:231 (-) Transcript_29507:2148-2840(-)